MGCPDNAPFRSDRKVRARPKIATRLGPLNLDDKRDPDPTGQLRRIKRQTPN